MTLERETFGPVLRAERERRGLTLQELAARTKVRVELWSDLEENNFSRWPSRIYARAYVRDYASRVGLDADAIVNEFCRLFPEYGDRRAARPPGAAGPASPRAGAVESAFSRAARRPRGRGGARREDRAGPGVAGDAAPPALLARLCRARPRVSRGRRPRVRPDDWGRRGAPVRQAVQVDAGEAPHLFPRGNVLRRRGAPHTGRTGHSRPGR